MNGCFSLYHFNRWLGLRRFDKNNRHNVFPYVLLQLLWFTVGSGSGMMPGDPCPSPSNWFLLMSLQSRELNQEIEEFLYVLQFQGKMQQEVSEKNTSLWKMLELPEELLKMHIPAARMEILILPMGLRHLNLYQALCHSDATK